MNQKERLEATSYALTLELLEQSPREWRRLAFGKTRRCAQYTLLHTLSEATELPSAQQLILLRMANAILPLHDEPLLALGLLLLMEKGDTVTHLERADILARILIESATNGNALTGVHLASVRGGFIDVLCKMGKEMETKPLLRLRLQSLLSHVLASGYDAIYFKEASALFAITY